MIKLKDGGPAFPWGSSITGTVECTNEDGSETWHEPAADPGNPGMSLRDWFAGMALQGILAQETEDWNNGMSPSAKIYAKDAYRFADAMIVERNKDETL